MDKLVVKGAEISVQWNPERDDFISLTDIAKLKDSDNPRYIIQNWLRNRNTIEFLGVWESLYNPSFNRVEFDAFRSQAGLNSFVMTPQKWVESTRAIGIISKAGRYGGTYAHKEIAFEFASWISVEFKLYLVKEFERLKTEEMKQLGWDIKRNLAKINYRIHTDAIKENLIPPELSAKQVSMVYASEADVLNMALFGMTAKQWRDSHPDLKGNIRSGACEGLVLCQDHLGRSHLDSLPSLDWSTLYSQREDRGADWPYPARAARMALVRGYWRRVGVCGAAVLQSGDPGLCAAGSVWLGGGYSGIAVYRPGDRLCFPVLSPVHRDAGQQPADGIGLCAVPYLCRDLHSVVHLPGCSASPAARCGGGIACMEQEPAFEARFWTASKAGLCVSWCCSGV